jgi:hypothetical protein
MYRFLYFSMFFFILRHLLKFVDPLTGHQRSEKRLAERIKSPATPSSLLPALLCTAHYAPLFHPDPKLRSMSKKYDKNLVHSLAIFQALYFAAHALNTLLGEPLRTEHLGRFYCGTFVYNLVGSLSKRADTVVNDQVCLPEEEEREVSFQQLFVLFERKLQGLKSSVNSTVKKAKNKSNKTTKAVKVAEIVSDQSPDLLASAEESDYCDVENKFAALALHA